MKCAFVCELSQGFGSAEKKPNDPKQSEYGIEKCSAGVVYGQA